ncbi:hypothetical protein COC69_31115 [Bacillus cereus]|uniref:Uncharacterized protein n=1 Tax=Bacillus cereus TaxID=1396 RepID=A0A9X7CHE9_BACCE|nr:hypothetical protein COC69_31115 [Bacillus cereus]
MISTEQSIVSFIDCTNDGLVYPPSQSIFIALSNDFLCLSHVWMAPSRSVRFAVVTSMVLIPETFLLAS